MKEFNNYWEIIIDSFDFWVYWCSKFSQDKSYKIWFNIIPDIFFFLAQNINLFPKLEK